jgi:hypothetical protein
MRKVFICLIAALMLSSCSPPSYLFTYTVEVRYDDGSKEVLQGSRVYVTRDPEQITFTMSSRLRMRACLTFGREGTNVACGVKSFSIKSLTYTKVKKQ